MAYFEMPSLPYYKTLAILMGENTINTGVLQLVVLQKTGGIKRTNILCIPKVGLLISGVHSV